jgi:hypothetical protein
MKTRDIHGRVVTEAAGTAAMICWFLILGPVGALLMLAMAYATVLGNSAWIAACALLLLSPLALTLSWAILAWPALLRRDQAARLDLFTPSLGLGPTSLK